MTGEFRRFLAGLGVALLVCLTPGIAYGHDYKIPVIVDTDMALDDIRAILMMTGAEWADIRLISTSDGGSDPRSGAEWLSGILYRLELLQIPVAVGRELGKDAPPWRNIVAEASPADFTERPGNDTTLPEAAGSIVKAIHAADSPVIFVCLGPLTNLADAMSLDPTVSRKISRVMVFGAPPGTGEPGWNILRDLPSAEKILNSGLKLVFMPDPETPVSFTREMLSNIVKTGSKAALEMGSLFRAPGLQTQLDSGHFKIWDEWLVLYLQQPDTFSLKAEGANLSLLERTDTDDIWPLYEKMFADAGVGKLPAREPVTLSRFPDQARLFQKDLQAYVPEIIQRHGLEEWKACVLTNELHRHLGIYSIIGAKMGIRAREILHATLDSLSVISYAGNQPPVSCFNDGLQVATGSSLGRGSITVLDEEPRVAATFVHNRTEITLLLKEEVRLKIQHDVEAAISRYGILTPEYFAEIRRLSLRDWLELDRNSIFVQESPEKQQVPRKIDLFDGS